MLCCAVVIVPAASPAASGAGCDILDCRDKRWAGLQPRFHQIQIARAISRKHYARLEALSPMSSSEFLAQHDEFMRSCTRIRIYYGDSCVTEWSAPLNHKLNPSMPNTKSVSLGAPSPVFGV